MRLNTYVTCAAAAMLWLGEARAQHEVAVGDVLLAPYDEACDAMATQPAPALHWLRSGQTRFFDRPIERRIHQIWFGDKERMDDRKVATWRSHAEIFGYEHRLWQESDLAALKAEMPVDNYAILCAFLRDGEYCGASDVLRVYLLEHLGGIYADVDIAAPTLDGEPIDLADVVPMTNIAFMSEHQGRNIGHNVALFVANGFMMSSAHHPLMQHLVSSLPNNIAAVTQASAEYIGIHVAYYTGPFYINRSLSGPITVLPITFLEQLAMAEP